MFPVTITINVSDPFELDFIMKSLKILNNDTLGTKPEVKPEAKPEAKPEKEAPKGEAKPAAASDAPPAGTQATQEPTAADSGDKTYTIDDAKQLTNKVVAAGKRSEMVALLAEFGVPVSAKLQPEQVNDFCKKAEALL